MAWPKHIVKGIHPHILKEGWKENHQNVNTAFLWTVGLLKTFLYPFLCFLKLNSIVALKSQLHFHFHFHTLEKEMATHCSVLAWRIPGTGEPGGLPSMGSCRVGHDWSDLAAAAANILWHRPSLGLQWKVTFSSPVATAEFSKFAGVLSATLLQHHLLGFEIAQLEFHHFH